MGLLVADCRPMRSAEADPNQPLACLESRRSLSRLSPMPGVGPSVKNLTQSGANANSIFTRPPSVDMYWRSTGKGLADIQKSSFT
jgi:hypothetical protein